MGEAVTKSRFRSNNTRTYFGDSLALGANGTNLILGDIISDVETERFIKQDPRGRNAIKYPHGFWPQNTVPYIIDETIGKCTWLYCFCFCRLAKNNRQKKKIKPKKKKKSRTNSNNVR